MYLVTLTIISLLLPALCSCTHHSFLAGDGNPAEPTVAHSSASLFAYDPALVPPPDVILEAELESHTIYRIHFPDRPHSLFPGKGVDAFEYRPNRNGRAGRTGIIILPIQGADYEVSTYFAEYFASKGFPCLRFERRAEWLLPDRDFQALALLIREYVIDIRRGLQWWMASGHADPDGIGLFGVSMGAMIGSMVAALERPSLRASVLVIGGCCFADILLTADDEEINKIRSKWLLRSGSRDELLSQELHQALDTVNPLRLASRMDPSSMLMIHARFDHVVRYPFSTSIWEAAGRPERIVIPTGHYSSVLYIRYIRWKALKWFRRRTVSR